MCHRRKADRTHRSLASVSVGRWLTGHERTPSGTMTLRRSAIARVRWLPAMLLTYGSSRLPLCKLSTKVIRSEATRSGCSHRTR